MSAQTARPASPLPRTICALLLLLFSLVLALHTGAADAQTIPSDVTAGLAKDETPGDLIAGPDGVDNDADTLIDEDTSLEGIDNDGDGADGEDPAVDVIKAGETQLVPVRLEFAAGGSTDLLNLSATIAGPTACNPRWISEGEPVSVTILGGFQFSTLSWKNVLFAAGEEFTPVRKYSVSCPAGVHAFNVYAHAGSAAGAPDPAPDNNQAENQLSIIATEDVDADGIANAADGCDWAPDAAGPDTDGDGLGDVCDADDDGDGFGDAVEAAVGTDPLSGCGPGAWPPDVNDDQWVNILDFMAFKRYILGIVPYDARFDVDVSGQVDLIDALIVIDFWNETCSAG